MAIGILSLEIEIPGCCSLKEKRSILAPLLHRLRKEFNISVSETEKRDAWDRSVLTVSTVQPPVVKVQSYLQHVVTFIERESRNIAVIDHHIEII